MSQVVIQNIIKQLQDIQEGGLWLEESFKAKFENLSVEDAFTKPIPQIHSVAELVWHILIWRKESMQRLKGKKTDLINSPDNWKDNDELIKTGWEKLKSDFYESQSELINVLKGLQERDLKNKYLDTDNDIQFLIEGLVHHDLYHLGQIGITIKLLAAK